MAWSCSRGLIALEAAEVVQPLLHGDEAATVQAGALPGDAGRLHAASPLGFSVPSS